MSVILGSRALYYIGAAILIGIALFSLIRVLGTKEPERITATVTQSEILSIVSVSGVVEAENTAELAFPVSDIVASVSVREGDSVVHGQKLATLRQSNLLAQREDAAAALLIEEAKRDELLEGPTGEERAVRNTNVEIAKEDLVRTIAEHNEVVENGRRTLLSTNLEALPQRADNDDAAPTISGTYVCENEGSYTLSVFRSGARSGYSYRLSGLESGTHTAYTESPSPLGSCGLSVQFVTGESYGASDWTVSIPNTRSSSYITNLNAYELALQRRTNAIAEVQQKLDLALGEQTLENASPREEALRRANASVMQASARLAVIDTQIADRTIVAPFDGMINNVDILPGETSGSAPVITMVANNTFELTARIPEIDVTKIAVGQPADVVFDARREEVISSSITFISPLAIEIEGVAYFEAKLGFEDPPEWLRGGLNADVDIIVEKKADVLRIPKRFLIEEEGEFFVLVPDGDKTQRVSVERGFVGNDGYVEVIGLGDGDTVIAP